MEEEKTIGTVIRKYRKERGLTQKQLGALCGISEQNIGNYERGVRKPKIETLLKISKALEVPVNSFVDLKGQTGNTDSRIKYYRLKKKMTQKELSQKSGVHKILISKYESLKIKPKINNLLKISKALDVPIHELIESATDCAEGRKDGNITDVKENKKMIKVRMIEEDNIYTFGMRLQEAIVDIENCGGKLLDLRYLPVALVNGEMIYTEQIIYEVNSNDHNQT